MKEFQIHKSGGQYWWRAVAKNGETLGHSEMYTTKQVAVHSASLVKSGAATAPIRDLTGEAAYRRSA